MQLQEEEYERELLLAEQEKEERRLLEEKLRKEMYCRELVKQATETRVTRERQRWEEQELDDRLIKEVLEAQMAQEKRYIENIEAVQTG